MKTLLSTLRHYLVNMGGGSLICIYRFDILTKFGITEKYLYIFLYWTEMYNFILQGIKLIINSNDNVTNYQEKKPLSKAAFKAIFSYNYSTRGSNHREAEEDTIFSWEMVLLNMIEGTFHSLLEL